jgi:hypothetical protein
MTNALGLTLLVAVVTFGLAHLAVHAARQEFVVATAVVAALGVSIALVAPFGAALLLLSAATATRLTTPPVPDTVPADWS